MHKHAKQSVIPKHKLESGNMLTYLLTITIVKMLN